MKDTFSVQSVLDDFLKDEMKRKKERKTKRFYASSLGFCKRKQIWKRKNEEESNLIDKRTLKVFSVGNIFHQWIQELLKKAITEKGSTVEIEKEVVNEEYDFKCRYDLLVQLNKNSKRLLYDFKSVNSRAFHWLKNTGKPVAKEYHKMQVVSPAVMDESLEVDECRLLYISKDDLCMVEIPVLVKDYKDKVINELKELNYYYKKDILPERIPEIEEGKPNWECGYCPFLNKCRGADWKIAIKKKVADKKKKLI